MHVMFLNKLRILIESYTLLSPLFSIYAGALLYTNSSSYY